MKKKLVAGLASTAMLATAVAPAFAANFSDVSGATAQATALLKALNVVNGADANGNFNPNSTITRAEFAKIAVRVAGLGTLADQYGTSVDTGFSDVPAGHWAAGYVAIAKAQGFVKGYGDGTFGANDNVKYEDVLTVLERILGYNDNLPGGYSVGYVANALNLGVKEGAGFQVGKAATRGDVAIIAQSILSLNEVTYSKDSNSFTSTGKSLLSDKYTSSYKSGQVTSTYGVAGQTKLTNNQVNISGSVYNVTADTVGYTGSLDALLEHNVNYVADSNSNLIYLSDKESNVVSGTLDSDPTSTSVKISGTTYNVAGAVYFVNMAQLSSGDLTTAGVKKGDSVTLITDGNKNASYVFATHNSAQEFVTATYAAVGSALATVATTQANGTANSHNVEANATVTRNGAASSLSALQAGDVIQFAVDGSGNIISIKATSNTVSGTLSTVQTGTDGNVATINVAGTNYNVSGDFKGQSAEGLDTATAQGLVSKSVTVTLDNSGYVAKLAAQSTTAASSQYLIQKSVDGINVLNSDNSVSAMTQLTLLGTDGKVVTKYVTNNSSSQYVAGNVYDFAFSSTTGYVDTTSSGTHALAAKLSAYPLGTNDVNQSAKTITINGATYNVTNNTVVYAASNSDITKWTVSSFANVVAGNTIQAVVDTTAGNQANLLAIFVTNGASTSAALNNTVGTYVGKYSVTGSSTTNYVQLNVNGTVQNFAYTGSDFASLTAAPSVGDLVYLNDSQKAGNYDKLIQGTKVAGTATSVVPFAGVANGIQIGGIDLVYNSSTKVILVKTSDGSNTVTVSGIGTLQSYANAASTVVRPSVEYTTTSSNVAGNAVLDTVVIYQ